MAEPGVAIGFRGGARTRWLPVMARLTGLGLFVLYMFTGPVDAEAAIAALRGIDPFYWGLAWAANLVPPLLIALRFRGLVAERGYAVGYTGLARDSFRSLALNTVAIAGVGDLYRLNRLRASGVPLGVGGAAAVLDRLFGVATLVAFAVVFQVAGVGSFLDGGSMLAFVATAACVLVLAWRFLAAGRAGGRLVELLRAQTLSTSTFLRSLAFSVLTVVAWIASVALVGEGLGLEVPIQGYLSATPLVALASFLPISVGGVGIREVGYVLLLAGFGASPEECVALGLAQYAALLGVALVGGMLFVTPERA